MVGDYRTNGVCGVNGETQVAARRIKPGHLAIQLHNKPATCYLVLFFGYLGPHGAMNFNIVLAWVL